MSKLSDNSKIQTGVVSSLKQDALNAGTLAKSVVEKEMQDMDKEEETLAEDEVMYRTNGEPVFNCYSGTGKSIVFKAGRFKCKKENKDICGALDYFVDLGRLTVGSE